MRHASSTGSALAGSLANIFLLQSRLARQAAAARRGRKPRSDAADDLVELVGGTVVASGTVDDFVQRRATRFRAGCAGPSGLRGTVTADGWMDLGGGGTGSRPIQCVTLAVAGQPMGAALTPEPVADPQLAADADVVAVLTATHVSVLVATSC